MLSTLNDSVDIDQSHLLLKLDLSLQQGWKDTSIYFKMLFKLCLSDLILHVYFHVKVNYHYFSDQLSKANFIHIFIIIIMFLCVLELLRRRLFQVLEVMRPSGLGGFLMSRHRLSMPCSSVTKAWALMRAWQL